MAHSRTWHREIPASIADEQVKCFFIFPQEIQHRLQFFSVSADY